MKLWRLEALRGASACYVVAGHLFRGFPLFFSFGQEAVMVFFLLSGFVIRYSATPKLNWGFRYYAGKRAVRIYSVLLCMMLAAALVQRAPIHSSAFWRQLGGNLLMLQDFAGGKPNVIVMTIFAGALWSLHYEWWFYMLFFPTARYVRASSCVHVVGAVGILAALTYLAWPYAPNRLLLYFPIWWAGACMAESYMAAGRVIPGDLAPSFVYLFIIAVILGAGCVQYRLQGGHLSPGLHPVLEARHMIGAILSIGIALAWQRAGWIGFRRLLGWGSVFAPISYALYVSHQPLMADAHYLQGIVPEKLELPLYLLILVLFCCLAELWIYRKINQWYEGRFGAASGRIVRCFTPTGADSTEPRRSA